MLTWQLDSGGAEASFVNYCKKKKEEESVIWGRIIQKFENQNVLNNKYDH